MAVMETAAGFWNPLLWILAMVFALAIAYLIKSFGVNKYSRKTEQTSPFFSGSVAPAESVRADNIYWGFFEAMHGYYKFMRKLHTGIVNDYVLLFVLAMAIMLVVVCLGGALWA